MGTLEVSLIVVNHVYVLMWVVSKVHPWVSAPIDATDNFCFVILASRILDRRPYTLPV